MTYAETIASMEMETKDVTVFQISTPHDTFYGVEYDITFVDDDELLRLKQISGLASMFADKDFSNSWE